MRQCFNHHPLLMNHYYCQYVLLYSQYSVQLYFYNLGWVLKFIYLFYSFLMKLLLLSYLFLEAIAILNEYYLYFNGLWILLCNFDYFHSLVFSCFLFWNFDEQHCCLRGKMSAWHLGGHQKQFHHFQIKDCHEGVSYLVKSGTSSN